MSMKAECEARVQAGAEWLDKVDKDWAGKINVKTLDIAKDHVCVLAQLNGAAAEDWNYQHAMGSTIRVARYVAPRGCRKYAITFDLARQRGFLLGTLPESANPVLTRAWKRQIKARVSQ